MNDKEKNVCRQAKELSLYNNFRIIAPKIKSIRKYNEFIEIASDKETGGLRSFVGFDTGDFNHVPKWLMQSDEIKAITYFGKTISVSEYKKIKGFKDD